MWRKFLVSLSTLAFAFGILFISLLRVAAVKYEFRAPYVAGTANKVLAADAVNIDYTLPFPGRVLPDSPLWSLKATRDRLWLILTTKPTRKAELKLLFADKRLGMALNLFEQNKPEKGFSTLTRAEKYLEEASWQEVDNRKAGIDTTEFLEQIANASLKHYEVIGKIESLASEEMRPAVNQMGDYAKRVYEESRNALLGKGIAVNQCPFDW